MNKNFICVSDSFAMGGKESCIIRMYEWAKCNGYNCILLIHNKVIINEKWVGDLGKINVKVYLFEFHKYKNIYTYGKSNKIDLVDFIKNGINYFITTSVQDWLFIEKLYEINKGYMYYHSLYVVHPLASRGVMNSRLLDYPYKKYLVPQLEKNNFIFMDEETKLSYIQYNHDINKIDELVVRHIPISISDLDINKIEKRAEKEQYNILTISRLVFPFKGYIIGLIKDFEKICRDNIDATLTIIGDGKDAKVVKEIVNNLDEEIKKRISIKGEISYNALADYLQSANVYVGMGTTIIDAAKGGLIAIEATANQMENYSGGFFSKECNELGIFYGEKGYDEYSFYELLQEVFNYSKEEYIQKSIESYETVKNYYDINIIMPAIIRTLQEAKHIKVKKKILLYDCIITKMKVLYNILADMKK